MSTIPIHTNVHSLNDVRDALRDLEINRVAGDGTFFGNTASVTAAHYFTDTDYCVLADTTGGLFSVYLQEADDWPGRVVNVKRTAGGPAGGMTVITFDAVELIDGNTSVALFWDSVSNTGDSVTMISDGDQWWII